MLEIKYSENAVKQLKKISAFNSKDAERIILGIEKYAMSPFEKHDIKFLKGKFGEFRRLRIGIYRVIFDNENNIMFVYEIKHRKDIYND
jgi:mRNA interferase RelE/StbE